MEQKIAKLFTAFGLIVVAAVITALPIMLLWNWLMPEILGATKIDFWQSLGLSCLSTILFKDNRPKE